MRLTNKRNNKPGEPVPEWFWIACLLLAALAASALDGGSF